MINQQLLDYIKQQLHLGESPEIIRNTLLQKGWPEQDLNEAFSQFSIQNQNVDSEKSPNPSNILDSAEISNQNQGIVQNVNPNNIVNDPRALNQSQSTINQTSQNNLVTNNIDTSARNPIKTRKVVIGIVLGIIVLVLLIIFSFPYIKNVIKGYNEERNKASTSDISALTGGINPADATPEALARETYIDYQFGFKINPPTGWSIDQSGQSGALAIFSNPKTDQDGSNQFVANINIVSESAKGLDLDSYVENTKKQLPISLTNYQSTENKKLTLEEIPTQFIGGTFAQEKLNLRNLQLILIKDNVAYIITGTALASTWDQYKDMFESMFQTFSFNLN